MTQPNTDLPVTAGQAATLDFEPWQGNLQEMMPDAAVGAMESNRVAVLLAASLMFKTKLELMDWILANDEMAAGILDRITAARDSLEGAAGILDGCLGRLICAGSSLEVEAEKANTE